MSEKIIYERIKIYFDNINEDIIKDYFYKFTKIKGNIPFIKWYNKIVLDEEEFTFKEFNYQWRLRLSGKYIEHLDYGNIKEEIKKYRNISEFYDRYCNPNGGIAIRREGSFCSKLFHTFLPSEFPPVDSHIRKNLGFDINIPITPKEILLIKDRYEKFYQGNSDKIDLIIKVLIEGFPIFRAGESSYMRILDMYLWLPREEVE